MSSSTHLDRLIAALQILPGVGRRSATRIAFSLLDRRRDEARRLAAVLCEAMDGVRLCSRCRNYADGELCAICASASRSDSGLLCVTETPADVQAIEHGGAYQGLYFVLHGHLSPIDGIGPEELGLTELAAILGSGQVQELILATNPTLEGEATASYIATLARPLGLRISRLASGIPLGGELDGLDDQTIAASLQHRRLI